VRILIMGVVSTTLVLSGCTLGSRPTAAALYDTCYAVTVRHALLERSDSLLFKPPGAVRLSREPWSDRFRLRPIPDTMPVIHSFASWRLVEADSLELVWSTGHDGILVRSPLVGDTLSGRAETVHDVGDGAHGTATLARRPCEDAL
jgi:hypothetical protein